MGDLVEIVQQVPEKLWETVRTSSTKSITRLAGFEWWNNKYYRENPPNDGFQEQTDPRGRREIPYERELFHPSPLGRFSLGDSEAVAYFSSDFGTNCCETIPELRENQGLSGGDLLAYLQGQSKLLDGLYGYPISVRIADGSPILDMHRPSREFLSFIVQRGPWVSEADFVEQVLRSWDPGMRRQTQAIAKTAVDHGFSGLLYASVRLPKDLLTPEWNLVVFRPECVVRDEPR
jgi:hypothetical protein